MSLGKKLREARKKAGLTQRQLAEIIGAKHNSVSNWEKGLNSPNPETIGELCAVLNITPNDLLIGDALESLLRTKDGLSPEDAAFLRKYRRLDAIARGAVDALVDYFAGFALREPAPVVDFPGSGDFAEPEISDIMRGKISRQSVAAGTGTYLDEDSFESINVRRNELTRRAAFYVPVSGDSMEPRYHNGDILIVADMPVEQGEIGIFTLGGSGYVKKLGESELISLNRNYAPIPMDESILCNGKVIGVLEPDLIVQQ
jgi:transcriptional regulator with XRE-family HTH domain